MASDDHLKRSATQDGSIRSILAQIGSAASSRPGNEPGSPNGPPPPGPVPTHRRSGAVAPGMRADDPTAFGKWIANVGAGLGISGLTLFTAQQGLLWALNDHPDGRRDIFDPMYLTNRAPLVGGSVTPILNEPTVGAMGSRASRTLADGVDIQKDWAEGRHGGVYANPGGPPNVETGVGSAGIHNVTNDAAGRRSGASSQDGSLVDRVQRIDQKNAGRPLLELALETRNVGERSAPTIAAMVDATIELPVGDARSAAVALSVLERRELQPGVARRVFGAVSLEKIFSPESVRLGGERRPTPAALDGTLRPRPSSHDPLAASSFAGGVIPASFPREGDDGSHLARPGDVSALPTDDEAYVPLSFTDLRPVGDMLRTVYFRPFIANISQEFAPDYKESSYYGRTDPVVTYASTARNVALSFAVHAFSPEDLPVIYRKLEWLASMVYPEYDVDQLMRSGPVVRMRVGDLIKSRQAGLPGVIKSLSYDYTDSRWELKKGWKLPMSINVTLSFLALHDVMIGRGRDGEFGGMTARFTPDDLVAGRGTGLSTVRTPAANNAIDVPNAFGPPDRRGVWR